MPPHKPEDQIAIEPDPQVHQIISITVTRSHDPRIVSRSLPVAPAGVCELLIN